MFVVWNPVFKFFVTPQLIHTDTEYIMLEQRFDKTEWSMEKRKTMIWSRMEQKSTPMLRRGLQMSSSSSTSTTTSSFLIDDILVQRPKVVLVQWKAAQVNITTFEVEFNRKNRSVGKLSKPLMQILRTSFPSYTLYPYILHRPPNKILHAGIKNLMPRHKKSYVQAKKYYTQAQKILCAGTKNLTRRPPNKILHAGPPIKYYTQAQRPEGFEIQLPPSPANREFQRLKHV